MSVENVSTESLLREVKTLAVGIVDPAYKLALNEFIRRFEIAKAAFDNGDVAKVVHGQWGEWYGLPKCLVCGYEYTDYLECHNYCGECGAKMDGERISDVSVTD